MKCYPEQLAGQLKKQLAPVYLVSGDVPLLVQEACDAIRRAAREGGCSERCVMHVESGFNWQELLDAGSGMSLFAERRLFDLRMPTGKPGDRGSKALLEYLAQGFDDNILLITTGKLEKATQNSKWFRAIDKAGVVVQVWPPDRQQFPVWVRQRMQARGLQPDQEAVTVLADRAEGNLLACNQEIEKLLLLHGPGRVSVDTVMESVVNSSRFDVFRLVDSALSGDAVRTVRILDGLKGEGVEPAAILWALSRELRQMVKMSAAMNGMPVERVLADYRVWANRKALVRQGLQRHSIRNWRVMLNRAARIDRINKGRGAGNAWDELLQLALMMTGKRIITRPPLRTAS